MERFGSAWSDSTGDEIDGNDIEINRLHRELKKREAERQQLIINNKHVLKRQQYTIRLLQKEAADVDKNLKLADSERKAQLVKDNFDNIIDKVNTKVRCIANLRRTTFFISGRDPSINERRTAEIQRPGATFEQVG